MPVLGRGGFPTVLGSTLLSKCRRQYRSLTEFWCFMGSNGRRKGQKKAERPRAPALMTIRKWRRAARCQTWRVVCIIHHHGNNNGGGVAYISVCVIVSPFSDAS